MSIIVHYIEPGDVLVPQAIPFTDQEMGEALKLMEQLRREGKRHVCMSSELADMVGKPGVDAIKDGKTPDGFAYEWQKRRGDPKP